MIAPLYYVMAAVLGLLLIYVKQQTEHDEITRSDPLSVQWARRVLFPVAALFVFGTILFPVWEPNPPMLILVVLADAMLINNAISIHARQPPKTDARAKATYRRY